MKTDGRIIEVMAAASSRANRYRREEDAYAMLTELRKAGFEVVPRAPSIPMVTAGGLADPNLKLFSETPWTPAEAVAVAVWYEMVAEARRPNRSA